MPFAWMRDVLTCAVTLLAAVVLAEVYALVSTATGEAWLGIAWCNTLLALLVVAVAAGLRRRRAGGPQGGASFAGGLLSSPAWSSPWLERQRAFVAYLPALGVVLGAGFLSLAGRLFFGGTAQPVDLAAQLAFVVWIPLIEELVFRLGAGGLYRRYVGGFSGIWFSALLFALVHASPTLANLWQLKLGLPLGPFLLAVACEILIAATGRVLPAVALHMACNATVVIFALGDARFLDWLGAFYG